MDSPLFSEASSLADVGARAAQVSNGVAANSNGEQTKRSDDIQYNKCGSLRIKPTQATALIKNQGAAARNRDQQVPAMMHQLSFICSLLESYVSISRLRSVRAFPISAVVDKRLAR